MTDASAARILTETYRIDLDLEPLKITVPILRNYVPVTVRPLRVQISYYRVPAVRATRQNTSKPLHLKFTSALRLKDGRFDYDNLITHSQWGLSGLPQVIVDLVKEHLPSGFGLTFA